MPTIKRGNRFEFISKPDLDKALQAGTAEKIRGMPAYQEIKAPAPQPAESEPAPKAQPKKVTRRAKAKRPTQSSG